MSETENAEQVSLYSLASWTNGRAFKSAEFTPVGRPVIKIAEVKKGIGQQTKFSDGNFDDKFRVVPGDMIFCWSGQPETSIGTSYWRGQEGWLNQHLFKVEPKESIVNPAYFYFLLQDLLPQFVQIAKNKQTTGLGHLTKQDLIALNVSLPSREEQRRIAEVLGALDDLIEVNRALARDCERLARLLASTTCATTTLSSFTTWGGLSTVKPAGQVDHYSLPAFDDGQSPERVDGSLIKSNKQQISQPCVLVSRLNPHIPRVWMVYPDITVSSLASTEFVPICAVGVPNEVVYAVCSAPTYSDQMNGLVTGTTGSHQRVDKEALTSVEVPDVRALSAEDLEAIALLVKQAHALRVEIRELASTRDELLPLLISGRVRVTEGLAA